MDMNAPGSSSQPKLMKKLFFKIVLEDGIIELPEEFVKEYGKELSKHVSLEVPIGGAPHTVEVERSEGRIWLHRGWQDFVDYYSIKYADFLMFRYQGGSSFHVVVFNKGGSEIDYPVVSDDDEEEEEYSVAESPQRQNRTKEASMADQSSRGFDESMARERVVERAKAFESSNLHFVSIMQPAYLSKSFLYIPHCSVKSFFYGRDNNRIRVNGPDGRAWLMKYYTIDPPLNQVRITVGWKKFVEKYHLKDGDACVFELLNSHDMEFNITIFHVADQA